MSTKDMKKRLDNLEAAKGLTEDLCRNATCPPDRRCVRLTDAGGLFLEVTPNGSKRWFWRYVVDGKVRGMSLGSYCKPGGGAVLVDLKSARLARDAARATKKSGIDPLHARKADRAESAWIVKAASEFDIHAFADAMAEAARLAVFRAAAEWRP
ncbi:MAG: hypothetical protein RLY71_2809 [Pseudomonadota bacterium]|jgi:hypothetical protein